MEGGVAGQASGNGESDLEREFPSLGLAYELVGQSYDIPMRRLEIIEGRIGNLITIIMALPVTLVTATKGLDISVDYLSPWFLLGSLVALLAAGIGLVVKNRGSITVISPPTILSDGYLKRPPAQFKNDIFWYACEHWTGNVALVTRKANVLDLMTLAFVVEVVAFLLWMGY